MQYRPKGVVTSDAPPKVISTQQRVANFFILHAGDQAWKFTDITISDKTIEGIITPLQGHEYYKNTSTKHANRYKVRPKNDQREVINEVYITVSEYNAAEGNEITIALENIEKIEIYDKAKGATGASFVFSGIGIVFGIIVTFIGLYLATHTTFS